jgi:hypothetical protein
MATAAPQESVTLPQRNFSPLAGALSYLVPGLGQIVQGRIAKGLLFFVCLYGLFFYGQYLGDWRNVYINGGPPPPPPGAQQNRTRLLDLVTDSARFFAQFWIGVAAWPAIVQNYSDLPPGKEHPYFGNYQRRPTETELNDQQRNSDKSLDLGWVYTVIAGVLNILVIYDALAGPAHGASAARPVAPTGSKEPALV